MRGTGNKRMPRPPLAVDVSDAGAWVRMGSHVCLVSLTDAGVPESAGACRLQPGVHVCVQQEGQDVRGAALRGRRPAGRESPKAPRNDGGAKARDTAVLVACRRLLRHRPEPPPCPPYRVQGSLGAPGRCRDRPAALGVDQGSIQARRVPTHGEGLRQPARRAGWIGSPGRGAERQKSCTWCVVARARTSFQSQRFRPCPRLRSTGDGPGARARSWICHRGITSRSRSSLMAQARCLERRSGARACGSLCACTAQGWLSARTAAESLRIEWFTGHDFASEMGWPLSESACSCRCQLMSCLARTLKDPVASSVHVFCRVAAFRTRGRLLSCWPH